VKCGGFRVSYRGDERIFDTAAPIVVLGMLFVVLALVIILMLRPYGLFGKVEIERV